jgi:hypothetical protein
MSLILLTIREFTHPFPVKVVHVLSLVGFARGCNVPEVAAMVLTRLRDGKMSVELEAQLRNAALYLSGVLNSDTVQRGKVTLTIRKFLMFGNEKLWSNVRTPTMAMGQEENGNGKCNSLGRLSCAGLVDYLDRPQIRTQLGAGHAGLSLDRQNEFSRDAALGSLQPVPDLRLCGADAIR